MVLRLFLLDDALMRVNINALLDGHQRLVDAVSRLCAALGRRETVGGVVHGAGVAILVRRKLTKLGNALIKLFLDVIGHLQFSEHLSLLLF